MTKGLVQLETVGLLQAMYPQPEELVLSPDTAAFAEDPTGPVPLELSMTLRVMLDDQPDKEMECYIAISTDASTTKITPRQPAWLNRQAHEILSCSISKWDEGMSPEEYILESIEMLKTTATNLVLKQAELGAEAMQDEETKQVKLERVWFWFPMLSTREKRKDLVDYAPRYGLTGFVLAGECCVEWARAVGRD